MTFPTEELQLRIHGDPDKPVLVYLPGLHGDWTLMAGFRRALRNRLCFVEVTYPRSLTWTIDDYARGISEALRACGLARGWLLGESFGSQLVWRLVENNLEKNERQPDAFHVEGIILAGGFIKHPWKHGPRLLRRLGELTSMAAYRRELKLYAFWAGLRHRRNPAILEGIREFVARRTERDREAMRARLLLLEEYDPAEIACQVRVPVHYLAGLIDPLVPGVLVRWWLRRRCPGYRGGKTFWLADHIVLASAPEQCADWTVQWMTGSAAPL